MIKFAYGEGDDQIVARIYRHSDGYPWGPYGVVKDLERFFRAVERATRDCRFDDPMHLSARFVVWQAARFARKYDGVSGRYKRTARLDFLGVGVSEQNHMDLAYEYTVNCRNLRPDGRPTVTISDFKEKVEVHTAAPPALVLPDLGEDHHE